MRLVDYLLLIRQRLALVGAVIGVVALISLGLSFMQGPEYEASARLRARPVAPGSRASDIFESSAVRTDLGTEAQLMQSVKVGERVAEKLGVSAPPSSLIGQIQVNQMGNSAVLKVKARATDPLSAQQIANAFAEGYLEVRREEATEVLDQAGERLVAQLQDVRQRLSEVNARRDAAPEGSFEFADANAQRDIILAELVVIRSQLRDLSDRSTIEVGFGEIIEPAIGAKLIRDTSPVRSLVFGFLLGTPLAVAIVLLLDSLSETVRTKHDAEASTGAPVLGTIPIDTRLTNGSYVASRGNGSPEKKQNGWRGPFNGRGKADGPPPLSVEAEPFSPISEAYRSASLRLNTMAEDAGARTILLTSPFTSEGKTTTVTNIALAHADRGQDVMLIDTDLRKPFAHTLMDASAQPGLSDLVEGNSTLKQVRQDVRPHLTFVGSGEPVERPDRLLSGSNVSGALKKLKNSNGGSGNGKGPRSAATLLLDGAPVLQATEALALARVVDGVVLVLRARETRRQAAARAAEHIRRAGGHLLGVILVAGDENNSGVDPRPHLMVVGRDAQGSEHVAG